MTKSVSALLFLAAALLTACGSSSSSSNGSSGAGGGSTVTNPCSLLAVSQAEAVLQDGPLVAKPETVPVPTCSWVPQTTPSSSIDLSSVIIILQDPAIFRGVGVQANHTAVPGVTIIKAPGIGDEAYFETTGESAGTTLLLFKKGNNYIQLSVHKENLTIEQVQDAEATLAQQVLIHLP